VQEIGRVLAFRAKRGRVLTPVAIATTWRAFEVGVPILARRACLKADAVMEVLVDAVQLTTKACLARQPTSLAWVVASLSDAHTIWQDVDQIHIFVKGSNLERLLEAWFHRIRKTLHLKAYQLWCRFFTR
jgi:hypothetical protein